MYFIDLNEKSCKFTNSATDLNEHGNIAQNFQTA